MTPLKNDTLILLAGGKSSRMREDKAWLPVGKNGTPLIRRLLDQLAGRFRDVIISCGTPDPDNPAAFLYEQLPFRKVYDQKPGQGPMAGILAGLKASRSPANFIIACDIPDVDVDYIEMMSGFTNTYDLVIPVSGKDCYEPLFAFYNLRVSPLMENLLEGGTRKILELFPLCRVMYVDMPANNWYRNLNTAGDYQEYLAWLEKKTN